MTDQIQRPTPYNIENEEAVLGSMLMDADAIPKVAPVLDAGDFYRGKHKHVYQALVNLHDRGEPADMLTIVDELERMERLSKVGGPAAINELVLRVPTSLHAEYYAKCVERDAILRRLIQSAEQIAQLAYQRDGDAAEVDEVLDRAESILFAVTHRRQNDRMQHIKQILNEYWNQLERIHEDPDNAGGLPTGYVDLDRLLGGFHPGDLIYLAARPSMGKTALSLGITERAAIRYGARVAFFSLEMSAGQIGQRLLSSQTGIDSQKLRIGPITEDDMHRAGRAVDVLGNQMILVDDTPAIGPMELRTKCRRVVSEYGLDLVVVDYIQLMRGGSRRENRVQEISYISRSLKALARELGVPILALSQLSRQVEQRADKRPMLSDLRESGSLEQDADVVMFIYRDVIYNEDTATPNLAEILVRKHRNGPIGTIDLTFKKELARFDDLEAGFADDLYEPAVSTNGNGYHDPANVNDIDF